MDLILTRSAKDRPCAIEIKSASAPAAVDLSGLRAFCSDNPAADLYCFCQTPRAYDIDRVTVLPWREGLDALARR
ncbi:MAG: hypothetical protein HY744_06860 [Deltaproteobacteria bacterium]|nr:hypothetical protein [Deltaproteobacteria bacterium]